MGVHRRPSRRRRVPRAGALQKARGRGGGAGVEALQREMVVGPGWDLRVPHGRGLRGVAGHRVAGAGAVFGGEFAVFHDLLQFRPLVLKPNFDLEKKAEKMEREKLIYIINDQHKAQTLGL